MAEALDHLEHDVYTLYLIRWTLQIQLLYLMAADDDDDRLQSNEGISHLIMFCAFTKRVVLI